MEPIANPEEMIRIDSHLDGGQERSLAEDVLDGLTRPFKELPPKHFYDARGAELFDQICELPEYYPTRAERAILEQTATELAVMAAEIEQLPDRTGFLKFVSQPGWMRVAFPFYETDKVAEPFVPVA